MPSFLEVSDTLTTKNLCLIACRVTRGQGLCVAWHASRDVLAVLEEEAPSQAAAAAAAAAAAGKPSKDPKKAEKQVGGTLGPLARRYGWRT